MSQEQSFWEFDLFVVGDTPQTKVAYDNLKLLCDEYLGDKCKITVHDLSKSPKLAKENQIMAIPTTIRRVPLPKKTLIGDLSNTQRVRSKLELK